MFLTSLSHFAFKLFLGIELPKLGVYLLLKHFLLYCASFVNKLLFTLNCGSIVVKLGVLLAKSVVLSLKLHILSSCHLISSLLLSLSFKGLKALEHLLTDLLGRFQIVVEFLFIDAILGGEKFCKAGFSLLQVCGLSLAHVLNAVSDDIILDEFPRLLFPQCLVRQVFVTLDIVHHGRVFLRD